MRLVLFISIVLAAAIARPALGTTWESPRAQHGVIDLLGWDGETQVSLSGEWLFFWNELLETAQIAERMELSSTPLRTAHPSQSFAELRQDGNDSNLGLATYAILIKNLPENLELGINRLAAYSSVRVMVVDQSNPRLILSEVSGGQVANEKSKVSPAISVPSDLRIRTKSGQNLLLVIQVANFHYGWGGLWREPRLSSFEASRSFASVQNSMLFTICGGLLLVGLFNLSLFIRRQDDVGSLLLAIFSFLLALRTFGQIAIAQGTDSFVFAFKFLFVTGYLQIYLYWSFLYSSFPGHVNRRLLILWSVPLVFATVLILALDLTLISQWPYNRLISVLLPLVALFDCCVSLIKAFRSKSEGALTSLIGGLQLILFAGVEYFAMYNSDSGLPTGIPIGIGSLLFAVIQSQIVSIRYASAFQRARHLSTHLQDEVNRATITLQSQKNQLEDQREKLYQSNEELKKIDHLKTNFFRQVSHELRTPLTLILGSLGQALKQSPGMSYLATADKNARRLLRLVNQLLDFQRLESQQNAPESLIDILRLTRSVVDSCRDTSLDRGVEVSLVSSLPAGEVPWVMASIDSCEKIIYNYLSNALKYTPSGGKIVITITSQGFRVRIAVRDSGCGISPQNLSKLFQTFVRLEDADQKMREGTGIGLALVKELAGKLGGRVGADSELGFGSSFWVELPRVGPEVPSLDVMIIDSEAEAHTAWQQRLTEQKATLSLAFVTHADQLQELLQTRQIGIALIESHQQVLPTLELYRLIGEEQNQCARILVTASGEQHKIVQDIINQGGLQKVLHKPLGPELADILLTLCHSKKLRFKPILDLLYVDDEESARTRFVAGIERYTSISRYKAVSTPEEAEQLLNQYRIRCLVSDINFDSQKRGIELLSYTAKIQPAALRIVLSGERSLALLEKIHNEVQVHKVFYKPAQLAEDLPALASLIEQSPVTDTQPFVAKASSEKAAEHLADIDAKDEKPAVAEGLFQGALSGYHILIVDDIPDLRNLIGDMLSSSGYQLSQARDGAEALARLQQSGSLAIDLVVTDWMMPRMSGPELIAAMHSDPRLKSIPTILLTAKTDSETRFEASKYGASAYLGKPFDHMELQSIVTNLLELKQGEKRIADLNRYITENVLSRFLPPSMVASIVSGHSQLDDKPKVQSITVLFCDLVGFTSRSEALGPQKIASVINSYLQKMTDVVYAHQGTVDKFLGDGLLILFGAPSIEKNDRQISSAVQCAIAMFNQLEELNKIWAGQGLQRFDMRIGIHHGAAIVGSFGGSNRTDYTAIGSTVNIASRIQTAAEPGSIFFSAAVRDYLEDEIWIDAGHHKLKGIESEMQLFRYIKKEAKDAA